MPRRSALTMYGAPSTHPALSWEWVEEQLKASGTYWVTAGGSGHPHPRPVWGLWRGESLHLSIGSPALTRAIAANPRITVHLPSGTDVVIVEGDAVVPEITADDVIAGYESKYGRRYDVAEFGSLTVLTPSTVLAWQAAGWAGKDSFSRTSRWTFTAR